MYKIYISAECNWVNNNRSEIMINTNLNLFNLSREKCGRTTLYVLSVDLSSVGGKGFHRSLAQPLLLKRPATKWVLFVLFRYISSRAKKN